MSGLKKTTINARAFYPEEVEQDHLEHVGVDTPGAGASSAAGGSTKPSSVLDDSKIILVTFEKGDPESEYISHGMLGDVSFSLLILLAKDPLNWGNGRKWVTTALLCFMTLTIGLSTSAYSSGITSMTEEFGVSTEAGEVGMFMFKYVVESPSASPSLTFFPVLPVPSLRFSWLRSASSSADATSTSALLDVSPSSSFFSPWAQISVANSLAVFCLVFSVV